MGLLLLINNKLYPLSVRYLIKFSWSVKLKSNNKNDFYKFVYENSCKKLKTQFVRAPEPIQVSSHEKSKYKMVELKPKEKYVKNNK